MGNQDIKCNCKYKEAFNNNHTPMLIIDPETGKIDDANLAACTYYLYTKEEMLSMKILDLNTLDENEMYMEMDKARTEGRKFLGLNIDYLTVI